MMDPQIKNMLPRLSADDCNAAQQAIDAEIEEVQSPPSSESARMLRARRNAYALINAWFPAELMVAIFYEISVTSRYTPYFADKGFGGYNFSREWVVVSHVCQAWRTIALGTPRLWEAISLSNPDVTALMLQRSGTSPISIDYRSWSNTDEPISTLPVALSHVNRAFEISLIMPSRELRKLVSKHLTEPMPVLKRLELWTSDPSTEGSPCVLPPGGLEGATTLRRLVLSHVGFLPHTVLPITLRELILYHLPEKLTVSQTIDLLEPLDNLRVLLIEGALRAGVPDPTRPPDLRRLSPRTGLSNLHLSAPARQRDDFMIRFPITFETQTTLISYPETLEDLRFGAPLRSVYSVPGLLRGLSVTISDGINIEAYITSDFRMLHPEMCFCVSVEPPEDSNLPRDETLRDFCEKMPLDSVERLSVESTSDDAELGEATAQLLASHLPAVRFLTVQREAVKYVLRAMRPQADGSGPAFPSLRTLRVYDGRGSPEIEKQLLSSIADCLVARKASGKAADLEELNLDDNIAPTECLQDPEDLKSWEVPHEMLNFRLPPEFAAMSESV